MRGGEGEGGGTAAGGRRSLSLFPSILTLSPSILIPFFQPAPAPGADVRNVGSDIAAGEPILRAGDLIGPAELGLAATAGVGVLNLHARPAGAVLSTGDELVDASAGAWASPSSTMPSPPSFLPPGKVYDANRPLLLALASAAGASVSDCGISPDAAGAVEAALDAALASDADILITTGGVSMGATDAVKPALAARGTIHFGKCKMKPGKPLTFATLPRPGANARPLFVFGLPGNPASAAVTFSLVVGPAIRALAGWRHPRPRRVHAKLSGALKLDPERPEYHRATLHWSPGESGAAGEGLSAPGGFVATSTGGQISSRLGSVRGAGALLELPAASGSLPAGSVVSVLVVGDVGAMGCAEEGVVATPGI